MSKEQHLLFQRFGMDELTQASFDETLQKSSHELVGIFFWGHDCPNCEVAKRMLLEEATALLALKLKWFHVNTYTESALGTRFGLHGVPTFLFFHQGRRLGRITPFPGIDPFLQALSDLRKKYPSPGTSIADDEVS